MHTLLFFESTHTRMCENAGYGTQHAYIHARSQAYEYEKEQQIDLQVSNQLAKTTAINNLCAIT